MIKMFGRFGGDRETLVSPAAADMGIQLTPKSAALSSLCFLRQLILAL